MHHFTIPIIRTGQTRVHQEINVMVSLLGRAAGCGGVINLINEITARELSAICPHDINIRKVTDPYFFLNLICTYNKPCPVHLLF